MHQFHVWHYIHKDLAKVGGVEKNIEHLTSSLKKLNIDTTIDTDPKIPLQFLNQNSTIVILHSHGNLNFSDYKKIKKLKKTYSNLFWVHISQGNSLRRVLNCKEFYSISGFRGIIKDFIGIKFSDANIYVSEHAKEDGEKIFKALKPSAIIPNGVNTDFIYPTKEIKKNLNFLFLGRVYDRIKNVKELIKAFEILFKKYNEIKLCIAPGIEKEKNFIKNLGVLNPSEVNLALHNSNALIIPSRYEADPLVVREAMATGIPIIGSDIPAITFACKTYKNFIKIEKPLNAPQIVNAVEKLISNNNFLPSPEIRSYDEVAKEYLKFYNKLVDIFLPDFPKKTLKNTLNS